MTVNEYAALLHVRPSSISNYAKKGHMPQSHAIIAVALGDAGDRASSLKDLLARYGVHSKPIHGSSSNVTDLKTYRKPPSQGEKK